MGSWEGRADTLRAQGIHRKAQTAWKKKRLVELRQEGLTLAVISGNIGVPLRTLQRWAREAGLVQKGKRGRPRGR